MTTDVKGVMAASSDGLVAGQEQELVWLTAERHETELFKASREGRALDVARILQTDDAAALNQRCHYLSANGKLATGTAFYIAARGGHLAVLQLLHAAGCDVEAPNSGGVTALCAAADYGHAGVVEWLLGVGVDKDAATQHGNTAMHWAAVQGHADIVALLLAAGCQKEQPNTSGETPLHWAADYNRLGVVELLVAAGVELNCLANDGCTPLHDAARKGHHHIVALLLTAGADRALHTPAALTARQLAEQHHHSHLVKIFDAGPASPPDDMRAKAVHGVAVAATLLAETRCRLAAVEHAAVHSHAALVAETQHRQRLEQELQQLRAFLS